MIRYPAFGALQIHSRDVPVQPIDSSSQVQSKYPSSPRRSGHVYTLPSSISAACLSSDCATAQTKLTYEPYGRSDIEDSQGPAKTPAHFGSSPWLSTQAPGCPSPPCLTKGRNSRRRGYLPRSGSPQAGKFSESRGRAWSRHR